MDHEGLKRTALVGLTLMALVACQPPLALDPPTLAPTVSFDADGYPPPPPPSPTWDKPYPPPTLFPTLSATEAAARQQTQAAQATEFTLTLRASFSPPPPTSTPSPDGTTCLVNRTAQFTLTLLPGWHTDALWDKPSNTMIYNYDPEAVCSECSLLPDGLKIDLSVISLAGRSFEQWVSEERVRENPGDPPTISLSDPYPYQLGEYSGVAYTATGYGDDVLLMKLQSSEKVISLSLLPEQSSALPEALAMLATLDLSGQAQCD